MHDQITYMCERTKFTLKKVNQGDLPVDGKAGSWIGSKVGPPQLTHVPVSLSTVQP